MRLADTLRRLRTDLARAESIVILDAACEALFKIILDASVPSSTSRLSRSPGVLELTGKVAELQNSPRETKDVIAHLHRVRNAVQHESVMVAASEVDALHADVVSLIECVVRVHLNLNLKDISLSDLFLDPVVRNLYRRAEDAQFRGAAEEAAIMLVAAFEKARFEEQQRLWGSMITWHRFLGSDSEEDNPGGLRDYVETLHEEVEVLKLRIDYKQYRKYCEIAPSVLGAHFGENVYPSTDPDTLIKYWRERLTGNEVNSSLFYLVARNGEWLPFAFSFVANAVLGWQQEPRRGFLELLGIPKQLDEPDGRRP